MKRGLYIVTILVSILLISLVSAGLLDSIRDALTGHAVGPQPTNVSVTVTGTAQVNVTVDNSTLDGGVTQIEDSSTTTYVNILVCDPNGVNDIDDGATEVSYVKVGEDTRSNTSCVWVSDVNSYCANFTCQVTMWYWDLYGIWTINATANDLGNQTAVYNDSYTFQVNPLKALTISPAQLNWTAITPGDTDAKADDPTTVNNTGNYDGTLNVTGLDLYGLVTTNEVFGVDNFTSGIADDCTGSGSYLANASQVLIVGSLANPGNLSAGAGAGQEQLFYCIPNVPQLSSQEYSTAQLGSWTVAY